MRSLVTRSLAALVLSGLAAGCFVTTRPPPPRGEAVIVRDECPPDHYWDGKHCKKLKKDKHD